MSLRSKFALPINLILVLALVGSLAWQWWRLEEAGQAVVRARLGEEAQFIRAAYRQFGPTDRLDHFLAEFCHAADPFASPEHQVAVLDDPGGSSLAPPSTPGIPWTRCGWPPPAKGSGSGKNTASPASSGSPTTAPGRSWWPSRCGPCGHGSARPSGTRPPGSSARGCC